MLGFVITIYLYPRVLGAERYGLTRLLLSVSFIFSQFAHLGMNNITIKYFPFFQDKNSAHNGFFTLVLFVPLVGMLLFLFVFYLFKEPIIGFYSSTDSSLFLEYYWYTVPLVFSILYFTVLDSYIRALYNSLPGSFANEIILRLVTMCLIAAFAFDYIEFHEFMIGFIACYFIPLLVLLGYLFKTGEFRIRFSLNLFEKVPFKELANFGFFSILGGVSSILVNNIDVIMLGALSGLTDTGIYAIAFYVGSVIMIPKKSVTKIAPTLIAKHMRDKNLPEIKKIYQESSLNQFALGALIYIGVWANLHNLFAILPPEYASGAVVILIIGGAKLIDMVAGINGVIILNSKYYRFDLYFILFLIILSISTNYVLIPKFGITGAAIATIASVFIYNTIRGIFIWNKFRIQPLRPGVVTIILISTVIMLAIQLLPALNNIYLDIVVRSLIISLFYTILIYFLKVSGEINILIRQVLRFARLIT